MFKNKKKIVELEIRCITLETKYEEVLAKCNELSKLQLDFNTLEEDTVLSQTIIDLLQKQYDETYKIVKNLQDNSNTPIWGDVIVPKKVTAKDGITRIEYVNAAGQQVKKPVK